MRIALIAALLFCANEAMAQPYAYVPNSNSYDVSVVDESTRTVVDSIAVGNLPWGVGAAPDGDRVYVTNRVTNDVSVIDTATNTVVATIPVASEPFGVVVSPDSSLVYVGSRSGNTVSVIDAASNTVVDTIPVGGPLYLDISADGALLFVAADGADAIVAIDTATLTVADTYPVSNNPWQVVVSPDATKAYATSVSGGATVAIDLGTGTVTTIAGSGTNSAMQFNADASRLYMTQYLGGGIQIVDTATDTLIATIATPSSRLDGLSLTPDGAFMYVASSGTDSVYVLDLATDTTVSNIAVGDFPVAVGDMFAVPSMIPPPIAQGVQLDASPASPITYAEEIIASPGSPVTLLNPAGDLNLSANLGYNFSIGEVRYARFECDNGLRFAAGSTAGYDGTGNAALGAINGIGGSAMHFSITANDNAVVDDDRLVITGERVITGTGADINCTYSLYDFPSQAAAGGPAGRVYSVSGPYVRFAASYALEVDAPGNPVADVESGVPAFAEFTVAPPTHDSLLGNIGGFSYGTRLDLGLGPQPLGADGVPVALPDLMDADTALVFDGDFSAAADVFFSPLADCSVNIQSADDFSEAEAVFTIGSADAMDHHLCFLAGTTPIPAGEYTVALDAVPAQPAVYAVADLGPLALGAITRNGTELQAPLVQVPGGWLSRLVITNTGTVGRAFRLEIFGEDGNVISTSGPMSGVIEPEATRVLELNEVLTGYTVAPRGTLKLTVAAPNNQIQGLYQIVNPDSGSISNHVMVRPGTN